jgi:hypothetical protein
MDIKDYFKKFATLPNQNPINQALSIKIGQGDFINGIITPCRNYKNS